MEYPQTNNLELTDDDENVFKSLSKLVKYIETIDKNFKEGDRSTITHLDFLMQINKLRQITHYKLN